jgi:hypothetical protein
MTSIALTDEQLARLREHAQASGLSLDEVVREAVDAYLAGVTEPAAPLDVEPASEAAEAPWQPIVRTAIETEAVDEVRQEYNKTMTTEDMRHGTARRPFSPEAQAKIDAALARIQANVPVDLTPEEIDAEIDAAWQEVRQERRARRGLHD